MSESVYRTVDGEEIKIPRYIQEREPNMVDHPKHYLREGAIECIDEMELIYGPEALMHFCLLSCHKYRYRAGLKNNGYEDLEKSDWYMRKYKELKKKIEKNSQGSLIYNGPDPSVHQIQVVPCHTH